MQPTPDHVTPLDWPELVAEGRAGREGEGLTQRDLAALADVSVATLIAFEKGETHLSLKNAFAVLRVLGLLDEPKPGDAQAAFVRAAEARWRELTAKLPPDSPARFPHGYWRLDVELVGPLRHTAGDALLESLQQSVQRFTGWPMFHPHEDGKVPAYVDGELAECWIARDLPKSGWFEPRYFDAAHSDFWQARGDGRLYLMRGYLEDGEKTFPPATIFDLTNPIWRLCEALMFASAWARQIGAHGADDITIQLRAYYSGLNGRTLRAWSDPLRDLPRYLTARSGEMVLHIQTPAASLPASLPAHLTPALSKLYAHFSMTDPVDRLVEETVGELLRSRI